MVKQNVNKKTFITYKLILSQTAAALHLLSKNLSVLIAFSWPRASQLSRCFYLIQVPQNGQQVASVALEHNRQSRGYTLQIGKHWAVD